MSFTSTAKASFFAALLTLSSFSYADQVFLTSPANNSIIYPGCSVDIGFRVQYSDLAILAWVQLQILDANDNVLIENIDNSSRSTWDDTRSKNLTWSIPTGWAAGDYTLRAHGDAYYPCKENNVQAFCPLRLEDKETLRLRPLTKGQKCPPSVFSSTSLSAADDSSLSLDAKVVQANTAEVEKMVDGSDDEGTTGFSTPLKINVDPTVLELFEQNNAKNKGQDLAQLEHGESSSSAKKIDSGAAKGGMRSTSTHVALLSAAMAAALIALVV
ncbi:hypothetical protein BGZ51_004277 [Haplosporangium sp. Z 767]|nr:hypothetical protein BGZ51_004277 [Haplosporangium sp. Z 767]KAF9196594.1 hypothetical protein BGZ50_009109 [Haplosporangium sp. Z 11]